MSSQSAKVLAGITRNALLPFHWYASWVRANRENASSLERLTRTFAVIFTDPSNMVNMEGFWTLSKMHAFANESIISTAGRRVATSEIITLVLRAVREVECLGELIMRKYKGHHATWNALLCLECVKCLLNACVHRQMFLVSWMWESAMVRLRHALWRLTAARPALRGKSRRSKARNSSSDLYGDGGSAVSGALPPLRHGNCGGGSADLGDDVQLVIPRVISARRHEHRHFAAATDAHTTAALSATSPATYQDSREGSCGEDDEDDVEARMARELAETIPFSWVDVLGIFVDLFMLVRPVLIVAAARRAFPGGAAGEKIASLAHVAASCPEVNTAAGAAVDAASKSDPMSLVCAAVAATPRETLFANWKLWGAFALLDAVAALLARLIKKHRVPVVYIGEETIAKEKKKEEEIEGVSGGGRGVQISNDNNRDGESALPPLPSLPSGGGEGASADSVNAGEETLQVQQAQDIEVAAVPAVVSRDSLRVQQAIRNMAYSFLRDPFFSSALKQLIYRHFVEGFINRIPLIGSIVGFQVSYFLCMQHYSFLYSMGE